MFIDGRMKGYLEEEPLRSRIRYPTSIFAEGEIDRFIGFLDELQSRVGKEQLETVRTVYGDDWLKPYNPFRSRAGNPE